MNGKIRVVISYKDERKENYTIEKEGKSYLLEIKNGGKVYELMDIDTITIIERFEMTDDIKDISVYNY